MIYVINLTLSKNGNITRVDLYFYRKKPIYIYSIINLSFFLFTWNSSSFTFNHKVLVKRFLRKWWSVSWKHHTYDSIFYIDKLIHVFNNIILIPQYYSCYTPLPLYFEGLFLVEHTCSHITIFTIMVPF